MINESNIPTETLEELLKTKARGTYQIALADGTENWSGSSLTGAARNWGSRYQASRKALLKRFNSVLEPKGVKAWTELRLSDDGRVHRQLVVGRVS